MPGGRPANAQAERKVRLYRMALRHYAKEVSQPENSPVVIRAASQRAARHYPSVPTRTFEDYCSVMGLPRLSAGRPSRELLDQVAVLLGDKPAGDAQAFGGTYGEWIAFYDKPDSAATMAAMVEVVRGTLREQVMSVDVRLTWAWTIASLTHPNVPAHMAREWCRNNNVALPPVGRERQRILGALLPVPVESREASQFSESSRIRRALEEMTEMSAAERTSYIGAIQDRWDKQAKESSVRHRLYRPVGHQVPGTRSRPASGKQPAEVQQVAL